MAQTTNVNVAQAAVHKMTVSIKTIVVDGRAMSLNLFRQFPMESIIAHETASLRGTVWGWVNYWPDDVHDGTRFDAEAHRAIIWEKDGVLLRDALYKDWTMESPEMDIAEEFPSVDYSTKAVSASPLRSGSLWYRRLRVDRPIEQYTLTRPAQNYKPFPEVALPDVDVAGIERIKSIFNATSTKLWKAYDEYATKFQAAYSAILNCEQIFIGGR